MHPVLHRQHRRDGCLVGARPSVFKEAYPLAFSFHSPTGQPCIGWEALRAAHREGEEGVHGLAAGQALGSALEELVLQRRVALRLVDAVDGPGAGGGLKVLRTPTRALRFYPATETEGDFRPDRGWGSRSSPRLVPVPRLPTGRVTSCLRELLPASAARRAALARPFALRQAPRTPDSCRQLAAQRLRGCSHATLTLLAVSLRAADAPGGRRTGSHPRTWPTPSRLSGQPRGAGQGGQRPGAHQ